MTANPEPRNEHASPRPAPAKVTSIGAPDATTQAFAQLFQIEADTRRAGTVRELDNHAVNDSQRLARSRQAFVVEIDSKRAHVVAATGMLVVDRANPMVLWVQAMVQQLAAERGLDKAIDFELPGYAPARDSLTRQYPFRHVRWQPLWCSRPPATAGVLYFKELPWLDAERSIATRLAETTGHARTLLTATGARQARWRPRKLHIALAGTVALALTAVPVPVSVLAPLEVVPRDADVVAMPFEGIVHKVLVQPNAVVTPGMPLVRLVDTVQRNRVEVAAREVAVAEARVEKATSLAFTDSRGRQELGLARAEHALKRAEHAYAREVFEQSIIKAERAGVAVFSDPRELEGRPLATGERLMLVAREGEFEIRVSLPVADSIVLRSGLPVKSFFDADPLTPASGRITAIDRHVRVDEAQIASYRITARLDEERVAPALGARGTAQIQGDHAPLFIYLFRRPLAALRQWIGL